MQTTPTTSKHQFSNDFLYEHCDVPPGVSLPEWRRSTSAVTRRRWSLRALLQVAPRTTVTPAR